MGNKRQEYNHKNIKGTDISIEISLNEYGFAWIVGEKATLFYYGIQPDEGGFGYSRFDFCEFDNDTDVVKEFNWVDFNDIAEYTGVQLSDWIQCDLQTKIYDLFGYYGYENVFGSSYYEGLTYEEIFS